MATLVQSKARTTESRLGEVVRGHAKLIMILGVIVLWVVAWAFLRGEDILYLPGRGTTDIHQWFTDLKTDLIKGRDDNVLMQFTGWLSDQFNARVEWLQGLISTPAFPRPVPQIGWFGVLGIAGWLALAVAGWRMAVATIIGLLACGYLGFWTDTMDTIVVTFFAVGISLIIGLPFAIWIGNSKMATAIATPILDVMQTFPGFVYLAPLALFFAIGPSLGVVVTILFALPPAVRIAAHGIRGVSGTAIEATNSLGQNRWQRLRNVQLPMAKRTIIVGVNQCIMAALSMVVIAGLVDCPGLGKPVTQAIVANQVGTGFVAGLCIVIVAVLLDRITTDASERSEIIARGGGGDPKARRIVLAVTGLIAVVMVWLSRQYLDLAQFPDSSLGTDFGNKVQSAADWVTTNWSAQTTWVNDGVTTWFLNPLQDLIAESPWYVTGLALVTLAYVIGGTLASATTVACLVAIYFTDLWYDSMVTLTSVLVATVFVMALAVVVGVWMARSRAVERIMRPILDAAQTMPPFVYLVPALGLFGPGRFTGIVAAVVYAAPIAIKLVTDGIRGVSATTVEAAVASGSSRWQIITKVQIPMARSSLVLAANQGLLFVLSMVVIGGLVGGGALGYDVVLGFSQTSAFGKGVCAGIAIVLLCVMIDRTTQRAARIEDQKSFKDLANSIRRYPRMQQ